MGSLFLFDTIFCNCIVLILIFLGVQLKRISILLISILVLQGCMSGGSRTTADRQRDQQMGCALMALSGNPSMASNFAHCGVSNQRATNTSYNSGSGAGGLLNSNRPVIYSYPIQWNQLCPIRYGGKPSLGHKNINGQKVCQYG